ncbi:MAG: hypothetical protein ACI4R9_02650 [Kiritimatiellia bacterium]
MDELPDSLKDEIAALESLDARALRRRYAPLVADLPNCALCGVLRATVAYRLQERREAMAASLCGLRLA